MATLRAVLTDVLAGRGRLTVLSGEPGIGKTRTAEELAAYARHAGARALWGRCYEGEGAPAFWPWVQIVRSAADHVDVPELRTLLGASGADLAQLVPEFRERIPELPSTPVLDPIQARERIFESIDRFLRYLSRKTPLVVVIDDLQGADLPSALLVQFMAQSLAQQPATRLLLVIVCRTAALATRSPLGNVLGGLTQPNGHEHLELGGFSLAEVARFVETHARPEAPPGVAAQLHELTEGNPLFLKEFMHLIRREGRWPQNGPNAPIPLPSTVSAVIARRLAALSPPCRQSLAAAAVIGRDFRATVVGEVEALDSCATTTMLEEGVQHQIIGSTDVPDIYRFSHALTRETLYAELPAVRRQQLHRRVGEALERTSEIGELLTELAHHFVAAGGAQDMRKASIYAQRAAERAVAMLAYEEAVRLAELGIAALDRLDAPHDLSRCELLLTLAHAQKGAVDTATSRATFNQAVALARPLRSPDLFARAVLGTRWALDLADASADKIGLIEEALEGLGPRDGLLRVRLLAALADELLASADIETFTRSAELSREAVVIARRVGDPQALSDALVTWISCACLPENLDERLAAVNELVALAETQRSTEMAAKASRLRLGCLFDLGDIAGAERELEHLARCAAELRLPQWLYWIPYWSATLATFSGRFADAERFAREALEVGRRAKEPRAAQMFPIQAGMPLLLQGRLPPSRGDGMGQASADMGWNWGVRTAMIHRAHAVGDETGARAHFEACAAHDFTDIPRTNRLLSLVSLGQFAAHFNDTRRAALLYPRLLPFKTRNVPDPSWGSVARFVGLTAATLGRVDEAAQHFEDAIAHNSRMGARPHLALTQSDYARLLLERNAPGDRLKGRALLHAARATASELGMQPLLAKTQALHERFQLSDAGQAESVGRTPELVAPIDSHRRGLEAASSTGASATGVVVPVSAAPPFIGRRREMETLRAAVEDMLAGHGRLVLLAGEPGIGKTRTAGQLASMVRQRGGDVLWGRCYEGEGAPPFWPWVQVLRACAKQFDASALRIVLGAGASAVAQMVPAIREQLPDLPEAQPTESPEARFRLFDSVVRFVSRAAQRVPLAVILDDLHGADQSSLSLLEFLSREIRDVPMLVLGTHRDVGAIQTDALTATMVDLMRESGTERLVLHGLSRPEIAQFVEAKTGAEPPDGLVDLIHQRTEGNPLFVGEYVQVLLSQHDQSAIQNPQSAIALAVPSNVRAVITRRLEPLSGACREVLRTAAVIGREFRLEVLAAAVGDTQSPVAGAASARDLLAEAVAARVLEGFDGSGRGRFAHALIRETLFEELGASQRQRLHRTVGESIERLDAEEALAELAYHFFEAGVDEKAVTYAQRAGDRALLLLAYEEAARLYQLGVDASARAAQGAAAAGDVRYDRQRCELLLAAGEAQNRSGDRRGAKESFTRAAALARTIGAHQQLASAALGFAGGSIESGVENNEVVHLLEEALAAAGEESAIGARILARLSQEIQDARSLKRRDSLSRQAVEVARRSGDVDALAEALIARHVVAWRPDSARERLELATEILALSRTSRNDTLAEWGHALRLTDLLELGDVARAKRASGAFAQLSEQLQQPFYFWVARVHMAVWALLEGRFVEGERLAQEAWTIGKSVDPDAGLCFDSQLFIARFSRGRFEELEAMLQRAVSRQPAARLWRCMLAQLYAEVGREAAARSEFEPIASDNFADLPRDYLWLTCVSCLTRVCASLNDTSRAYGLYDQLLPYAEHHVVTGFGFAWNGAVSHYLAVLASITSQWDEAVRHFDQALATHTKVGARAFVADTQYEYAAALLKSGDQRKKASALLSEARNTARDLGMKSLEEKIARLLEDAQPSGIRDPLFGATNEIPETGDQEPETTGQPITNLLRREGDYWTIAFDGCTFRLKDSKGLQYLAHLIRHPDREFHVLDLATQRPADNDSRESGDRAQRDLKIPSLDATAKAQYARRVDDLREELREAERNNDRGRSERARAEMELIGEQLATAVGLGGRDRTAAHDAERARLAVTKRIKAALKAIQQLHPSLARHLSLFVKTGYFCAYHPSPDAAVVRVV
jgi:predicted ATPase